MRNIPIVYEWTGEVMQPLARFQKYCDKIYVIGERYVLSEAEEASARSRGHYFASLHEAWMQLPEGEAERFPTDTHLRRWALIRAGYADQRSIVCASKAEAQRVAAFCNPLDEYAVVTVSECVVQVFTAKSQSKRAMGKDVFSASKQAVLEIAWGLVGIDPAEAAQHVGQAA